jgi:pyruvate,water dikinase
LTRLVNRVGVLFDGPQDVEWALDAEHRVWLLQSRPITAQQRPANGPRFGPGPLAETFPDQLAPLEEDLWLAPVRDGIARALVVSGARRPREVERSAVVTSVGGRPAVDLDLIGAAPVRRRWWTVLDPRPGVRRLAAAWRVGRLRSSLPALAEQLIHDVDGSLLDLVALDELDDDELLLILRNSNETLRALHGHEVLMGMLLPTDVVVSSVAAGALAAVERGRRAGRTDAEIVQREPIALALLPPRIGAAASLPTSVSADLNGDDHETIADRHAMVREALRLRIRWVHELTARAAWELAMRIAASGAISRPCCLRDLRLEELADIVEGGRAPQGLSDRLSQDTPPLPAVFRLRDDGTVASVDAGASIAVGAGGGRAEGIVHIGEDPPAGAVLVADALKPQLAWVLPNLSGLIVETGSPLSHLAILAREAGVATVVAYPDATSSFEPGEHVLVDGATGEVTRT